MSDLTSELLGSSKSLQLATINADGSPHLVTMWYGLIDDQLVFWTQRRSRKAANLRRDPRIACLVEAGTEYGELRGVSIEGRAELVEHQQQLAQIGEAIVSRNFVPDERPDVGSLVGSGRRIGVIVHPVHISTWDFSSAGKTAPSP